MLDCGAPAQYLTHKNTPALRLKRAADVAEALEEAKIKGEDAQRRRQERIAAREEAKRQREVDRQVRVLRLAKERREKEERRQRKLLGRDRRREETLERKKRTAGVKANARDQRVGKADVGSTRKRKRVTPVLRASPAETAVGEIFSCVLTMAVSRCNGWEKSVPS